jgi:3-oxoacyl-[acyl-carrier-protein] synthase III
MSSIRASITGIASSLPEYRLTNAELETMVDTSDEWILSRTGIAERRILREKGQGTSTIAIEAVRSLLDKTGVGAEEIDLIICCTTTPDLVFPATANIIGREAKLTNAFGYDLSAACSGFLYGLATASAFVESGRYKKVIVVGADKMSSIIDYTDRTTCIIFGDGAGAVLIEPSLKPEHGIVDYILRSDGSGEPYLHMKAGGSRLPASAETVAAGQHYVYQEGAMVYKFAVTNMYGVASELLTRHNLTAEDIDWMAPHQANRRIIEATAQRLGVPEDKVLINIHRYGNTTNGTLPLVLADFHSQFALGDRILMAAFGGGFTWGAMLLNWGELRHE